MHARWYVWALDSDIDFTSVDLIALFSLARASQSLIVGPTFAGSQSWLTYTMSMHEVSAHGDTKRLVRRGEADSTAERINVLGKPDPRCKLRHTDFVEMTAPLLSNKVLALILKDCVDCVHDKAEWGLDPSEEAAVVNSSGQAELQDLSQSSSFEMPELADAYIFDPNASMLQSLRDSSASARRRSSYVVMNYHQWGSNQKPWEPNGIWNPYKHAKNLGFLLAGTSEFKLLDFLTRNEFHNYCGSKGEPVTLGQLYNDVSVTCSGSYGGHENCGYATCAEGEVIEQIAFGTTAASTWSPVLTLDFIERVYIDKGPLNPNSQLEGRVAAGNGILPEEAEVIRLCLTDDEARVARHSAN
ncbi:unnamed protein product [Symbiodinium sp. KB8]|nr:unnamed protein product [Symbiodinium sp. KB8]